jgi:signal recognition particle subunit SRP19
MLLESIHEPWTLITIYCIALFADETFHMQPEKFIVIYPSYLDSTKTVKMGRRIAKERAVDTPTVSDISMALQTLTIKHVLQPYKGYSRDITTLWDNPGRIKVDYDNSEKTMLLKELAEIIPTLPERIQRLEAAAKEAEIAQQKRKEEEAKDQQQRQLQKHQQAATKTNNKKKGNKKKK